MWIKWCKMLIYVLFYMSSTKKLRFREVLTWFLILGKIQDGCQDGDHCWWRHRPQEVLLPHKIYSQTSLIRTPKGQSQVSALRRCPYYRGRECMIFGISKERLDCTSSCWEDHRFSVEGTIVPKYWNISKALGRGSFPPYLPPYLYHGGGINFRVRPRVKVNEDYAVFPSFHSAIFFAVFQV